VDGLEATGWVAIYAAAVSTGSLGWQIWNARQARRPQVEVVLSNSLLNFVGPEPEWAVQVDVRNHGDQQVRVTSVGFNMQDGSGRTVTLTRIPPLATLPGEIAPRDSGFTYLLEPEWTWLDPFRPLVAWVKLSTGQPIYSKPFTLRSRGAAAGG
jgi:hypothetical protein